MPQVVAVLVLVVAVPAAAQGFTSNLLRVYDNFVLDGRAPRLADFNGDGRLDAAVINSSGDSLVVALGDGFGGFGPVTRYATGAGATDLAVGDLNVDGRLDLVTANQTAQTVSVLAGSANGAFSKKLDFNAAGRPYALAIGDVTGDGRPDVVTANRDSNSVTVLSGIGTGTGITGASITYVTPGGPSSVALGDVDANGLTDIVFANSNSTTISVLRAQPAGGFAPKLNYTTASNPLFVRLADLDNDGDLDAVTVSGSPGNLSTLLNNGSGAFPFHDDLTVATNPTALEIGDLDGDAVPDAALGVNQLTVLRGSGFGSFFSPATYVTNQAFTKGLALGDVDGDGFLDVFLAAAHVTAVLAAPSPFGAHQDFTAGTSVRDVAVADLNGDALPDIVAANNGSANVSVLLNAGAGLFPAHVEYATPSYPNLVRAGDTEQDGFPELFVGTFSPFVSDTNRVWVLPNLGDGTFGARKSVDPVVDGIGGLALADINHDSHLDFVDTHWNGGATRPFFGNGTGGFNGGTALVTANQPAGVVLADIDADTKLDLLQARFGSNTLSYYRGDGIGNVFFGPYNGPTGANGPIDVVAGDADGDGIVDAVVLDATSHAISLFKGANIASLGTAQVLTLLGANSGLALNDVNRDGIVDVVFGSDAVSTLFGQGHGVIGVSGGPFGPRAQSPPIGEKFGLALADLDRNGTLDAVVAATNAVSVLYGLQQTRTALTVSPNPAPIGTTLTFTARVTPAWPDSSDPTGTARFFDGFTLLGTAPIVGGVATFIHDANYPWERSFRAEYRGDFRFHGSFSPSVPQTSYPPNVGVAPGIARLALAPLSNPTSGAIRMRVELAGDTPATLALFDVRGRVLSTRTVGASGVVDLSSGKLAPGVYLVRVVQDGQSQAARVVVL